MQPLMLHQAEAVAALTKGGHHFIAHEPGLGKTRSCIEALMQINPDKVLVVCPAIARQNWRDEIRKWAGLSWASQIGKPGDAVAQQVFITSYDHISRMKPAARERFLKNEWDVLILDEAHRLKTWDARRTLMVYGSGASMQKSIAARAKRVWLLTGTPCPNHVGELWTHLRALWPQSIKHSQSDRPLKRVEFEDLYCQIRTSVFGRQVVGSKNVPHLKQRLNGFFHPKRVVDAVDLPKLILDSYALPAEHIKAGDLAKIDAALEPITRDPDPLGALRKFTTHVSAERRLLGVLKIKPFVDLLNVEAESYGKVLVFGHHRDVLDELFRKVRSLDPVLVHGGTTDRGRGRAITRFQTDPDCRVFIGQTRACGEAINLTSARRVLF
ncbi:MAG: SNF2-related protein, partial [Planctomycetota bacterium]